VPGASPETIKAAYAALARRFHPDRNRQPGAAERMQRINEAYAVLGVPYRRRNYDLERFKTADPLPEPAPEHPAAPERRRDPAGFPNRVKPIRPSSNSTVVRVVRAWTRRGFASARRHPIWLGAGTVAGGLLLLVCVVAAVTHGGGGAKPAATAAAAGHGVRVVAATTPLPPSPAATIAAGGASGSASRPPRADDVLFSLAQRFPPVNALSEANRQPPGADRGWVFSVDGCTVFAGEYDAPERADGARRFWSQQSGRYTYEGSGPVVAAVGDCDAQQHQFELLNAIADAFARPH